MKAVVQRVTSAQVEVDGQVVGSCRNGLLILLAAHKEDTAQNAGRMAEKIYHLRIFNDTEGKMNLAMKDLEPHGEALAVSNFTVYGDTKKSRRPSFTEAAGYEQGEELFQAFLAALAKLGTPVQTGIFGADMKVSLVNDGPVTVIVEA